MVLLLAPAGDFASLVAALDAGCDAVYFGIGHLNMRARGARNFLIEDLPQIMQLCHERGVLGYLALNTVLHDHDLALMDSLLCAAIAARVDAVIVADSAAMIRARELGLSVHISTQLSVSNYPSVAFYSSFADCIVLARELTLPQITAIKEQIIAHHLCGPSGKLVKIECFAHGALCIAYSGRCFMSLFEKNASANRGACFQTCRKAFRVTDEETGEEMRVENKYVLSPEDLCTLPFLDRLVAAGVDVLKIEGRGRSPEYVKKVVSCYRQALDALQNGIFSKEFVDSLLPSLKMVYNRGLSEGFYFGRTVWSGVYGSKATHRKVYVGKVLNYYKKSKIAFLQLEARELFVGETLVVIGDTTGVVEEKVSEIHCDDVSVERGEKGSCVTLPFSPFIRVGDRCYVLLPVGEVGSQ